MSLKFTIIVAEEDSAGEIFETDVHLPAKYEVCSRCRGTGKHCNPSIDGNGLTAEDFAEDPDFKDDYFAGVYDVTCYECYGERVILTVDEEQLTPEQCEQWMKYCENERARAEERASELRWRY